MPALTGGLIATPVGQPLSHGGAVFSNFNYDWCIIRKVDTSGVVTTVAGSGRCHAYSCTGGFSGDGGPATSAMLNDPRGIAVDSAGNLYIADHGNERIRKVDTSGIITTIAGNGTHGFSGDGGPALIAQLNYLSEIALDTSGNLFIADGNNQRIRKIRPTICDLLADSLRNDRCVTPVCNEVTGQIDHIPVNTDDHNMCTKDSCHRRQGVKHVILPVPSDNNECTYDNCDPQRGFYYPPVPDGQKCTLTPGSTFIGMSARTRNTEGSCKEGRCGNGPPK